MAQLFHWPVPCTICETPVEYHCNTCGDVLCKKCRDNHLKSNATKHHNVVPYSQRIEPGTSSSQCGDHPGHQCGAWCQTCNRAVCSDCVISDSHFSHRFLKLDAKIKEKREKIQNQLKQYSSLLSDWQTSVQESEKEKEAYEKDFELLDKEIVSRADELCNQVRAMEKESRKQLIEMKEASLRNFHDQQKKLTEGVKRLKQKIKHLEDTLRSQNTSVILQSPEEEMTETKPTLNRRPTLPVFIPGSSNAKILMDVFGSLSDSIGSSVKLQLDQRSLLSKPSVEAVIEIEETLFFPAIACTTSHQAWIKTADRKLQLVDRQGKVQTLSTFDTDFSAPDISTTPEGKILLPDFDNRCIKTIQMDNEGVIKTKNSISIIFRTKWRPYGICCLYSGDIVVAFTDDKRVVQYTSTGKVVREIDSSLFQYPYYVASSEVNKQLYISDKSGNVLNSKGRVLALDMNGTLQYAYTGPDPETFTPRGLCTDQVGHVLITDRINNRVHIIDKGGNFLQYLLTGIQGLTKPCTIDVDSEGYAWVGESSTGKVKVVKYMQGK